MNINNHNYQSFLLLYADGELLPNEMEIVDAFVNNNEEAKQFLESLLEINFGYEEPILFHSKALLYKKENDSINEYNYYSYFLLYADDELSIQDKKVVDIFVVKNSALKPILNQLLRTKNIQDTKVVYPNKEELYRKQEKKKIFYFNFKSLAIAAIFIGFIAMIWMITNKEKGEPQIALSIPKDIKSLPPNSINNSDQSAIIPAKRSKETNMASLPENNVNTIGAAEKKSSNSTLIILNSASKLANLNAPQMPLVDNKKIIINPSNIIENHTNKTTNDLANTLAVTSKKIEANELIEIKNNPSLPILPVANVASNTQAASIIYKTLDIGADDDNVVYVGNMKLNKTKIQNSLKKVTKIFGKNKKSSLEEDKTTVASL